MITLPSRLSPHANFISSLHMVQDCIYFIPILFLPPLSLYDFFPFIFIIKFNSTNRDKVRTNNSTNNVDISYNFIDYYGFHRNFPLIKIQTNNLNFILRGMNPI